MISLKRDGIDSAIIFDDRNYVLGEFNSGAIDGLHSSNKVFNQHGETIFNTTLGNREPSVKGYILGQDKRDLEIKRQQLLKIINPIYYTFIEKNDRVLIGKPLSTPIFSTDYKTSNEFVQEFAVSFFCDNPFWRSKEEQTEFLATWTPDFYFPIVFEANKDIYFGHRTQSLIIDIVNDNVVDMGMIIEFIAQGEVANPSIVNVNTQESLKVNLNMLPGEILKVDTRFGEKRIEHIVHGVVKNAFPNLDEQYNTFLQLHPGSNLLRYNADSNLEQLEIKIHRYNYYVDEVL